MPAIEPFGQVFLCTGNLVRCRVYCQCYGFQRFPPLAMSVTLYETFKLIKRCSINLVPVLVHIPQYICETFRGRVLFFILEQHAQASKVRGKLLPFQSPIAILIHCAPRLQQFPHLLSFCLAFCLTFFSVAERLSMGNVITAMKDQMLKLQVVPQKCEPIGFGDMAVASSIHRGEHLPKREHIKARPVCPFCLMIELPWRGVKPAGCAVASWAGLWRCHIRIIFRSVFF
mmetsp:Transcript_134433/g.232289  ORF Transcript_134433/g.232289 Transcript_134433/m.232289 type:complete len:229 (-) Transcript_134433:48-734(-)